MLSMLEEVQRDSEVYWPQYSLRQVRTHKYTETKPRTQLSELLYIYRGLGLTSWCADFLRLRPSSDGQWSRVAITDRIGI